MSLRKMMKDLAFLGIHCRDLSSVHNALVLRGRLQSSRAPASRDIAFRGLPYPIRCRADSSDMVVFWEIFRHGEYEMVRHWPFSTVLDLGANSGMFGLYCSKLLGRRLTRYIGVEPDVDAFAAMEVQIANQRLSSISSLLNCAASDRDGFAGFDRSGASWMHRLSESGTARVLTQTISTILDRAGVDRIDLLKMDVEGAERELLESLPNWGHRAKALVVELHDDLDFRWFSTRVERAGFRAFDKGELFSKLSSAVRLESCDQIGPS